MNKNLISLKTVLTGLCVLALICQFANAQQPDSAVLKSRQKLHDFYRSKGNNQNRAGWIFLGTGLTLLSIGAITGAQQPSDIEYQTIGPYLLLGGGLISSLTSIPFFVSAGSNKRKAALSLKGEKITMGAYANQSLYYTAVLMTIKL